MGKLADMHSLLAEERKEQRRARAPAVARRHQLRQYGMTLDDYDAMLAAQGGVCAICGSAEPGGSGGRFAVDHDHATGDVRGLLCAKCNTGLGLFGDDVPRMVKGIVYLAAHK